MELVAIYIHSFRGIQDLLVPINSSFECTVDTGKFSVKRVSELSDYYQGNRFSVMLGQNGSGKTTILDFIEGFYSQSGGEGVGIFFSDNHYYVQSNLAGNLDINFDAQSSLVNNFPNSPLGLLSINNVFDMSKFVFRNKLSESHSFIKITANTIVNKGRKRAFNSEIKAESLFFKNNSKFMESIGSPSPNNVFKLYKPLKSRFTSVSKNIAQYTEILEYEMKIFEEGFERANDVSISELGLPYRNVEVQSTSEIFMENSRSYNRDEYEEQTIYGLESIGNKIFSNSLYDVEKVKQNDVFWLLIRMFISDLLWKSAQNYFMNTSERDYFYLSSMLYTYSDFSNIEVDGENYIPEKLAEKLEKDGGGNPYHDVFAAASLIYQIANILIEEDVQLENMDNGISFTTHNESLTSSLSTLFGELNNFLVTGVEFGWSGLSSGESAMIKMFSRVYSGVSSLRVNQHSNFLLIVDEADLYLHPEWQRSFLKRMLLFINSFKLPKETFQIILSSHSPIISSDFLANDIITLLKVDNRTVISKDSVGFGTSINNLYLNSFSLESSIGEYSRETLAEIFKSAQTKGLNKLQYELIDEIGDDLIRDGLKEYLKI